MQALPRGLSAAFLAAAAAAAAPARGNALAVIDAYLVRAARTEPRYRADLRVGGQAADGRLLGWSPTLGAFTYRPRTYAELTGPERAALWRAAGLRAFVAAAAAGAATVPVAPAEALRPGPLVVVLPRP